MYGKPSLTGTINNNTIFYSFEKLLYWLTMLLGIILGQKFNSLKSFLRLQHGLVLSKELIFNWSKYVEVLTSHN